VRDAVLFVDISPDGIFEHVFVEKSSGDAAWDNRVVNRVRQWRAAPSVAPRSGRLILQSGSYRADMAMSGRGVRPRDTSDLDLCDFVSDVFLYRGGDPVRPVLCRAHPVAASQKET
jgi:hypothetical protein